VAMRHLVPDLSTIVAGDHNLFAHFRIHVSWTRKFKSRMSIGALGSQRAEACQVVDAQHPSHMSVSAVWTVPAETSVIPGTVPDLGLWVYVEKGAFFVVTGIES